MALDFLKELESLRTLTLTQYEALFLSDSVTLLMEHDGDKSKFQIPMPVQGQISLSDTCFWRIS